MGLDDNLLAQNKQESGEEDMESQDSSAGQESAAVPMAGAPVAPNQPQSLREAVRMDKAKKDAMKKGALSVEKPNPIRMRMSSLLRSAWLNLIPSFGLTLLWIDAHIFLRQVLGKTMFCKLGEEWFDKPGVKKPAPKLGGEKKEAKMITMSEPMGVACCNFGCLLALLFILVIISMIAGVADFLIGMVKGWFTGIFS